MEITADIKEQRSEYRYYLPKQKSKYDPLIKPLMREKIFKQDKYVAITGIVPGVISTAVLFSSSTQTSFESINRLQSPAQNHVDDEYDYGKRQSTSFTLTANQINHGNFMTKQARKRKSDARKNKRPRRKTLDNETVTRSVRTNTFHQKLHPQYRQQICTNSGTIVINFIGNWSRVTTRLKGYTRRRLQSLQYDMTILCAVVYFSDNCPRRLTKNMTTINRDQNGSYSISLAGLSKIFSVDYRPLPVFDRRKYKSNSLGKKYL
ncbi:hypothetical protein K501DRAFT_275621 [Backusella circina FSU 941]|nr:hypothetical protein K501DRAFT_275621 [Backusella circina FSU 941]